MAAVSVKRSIIISRLSIMQKFYVAKVLMFSIFFAKDRGFTNRLLTAKRQCRLITDHFQV